MADGISTKKGAFPYHLLSLQVSPPRHSSRLQSLDTNIRRTQSRVCAATHGWLCMSAYLWVAVDVVVAKDTTVRGTSSWQSRE